MSWRSVTLAASGWVALVATLLPSGSIVRSTGVAVFLLCCPGAALVRRFWPGTDRLERAVMAVALSVSVSVLVTELQTFAGGWQPRGSIVLLALIATLFTVPRAALRIRSKEKSAP
jgi:uncharacterized membrane protein